MSFPIFDPLPVPPFELPERVRQIREQAEEASRPEAAPTSRSTTPDSGPTRTPIGVQAPVPARRWVLVEDQVTEWVPEKAPQEQAPLPVPARRPAQ